MIAPADPRVESRIDIVRRSGVWILTLHGEHDLATQPSLRDQLGHVAAAGGPIVVDLSHATFLDSSVIRALASPPAADGREPPPMAVVAPPGSFAGRLVELVGLSEHLDVHPTLREADSSGGSRR
jgi:anti-anti-sigma factor